MKTFLATLSQEEEKDCFLRKKQGDVRAKEELILHNMRLVAHVAKRYVGGDENPEDMISIGTIGLIKAVDTFDLEFGSRFATYAIRCIDNEMLMYLRGKKKTKGEVSLSTPIGTDKEGNQIHLFDILEHQDVDVCEELEKQRLLRKLHGQMKELLTKREYAIIVNRFGLFGNKERTQREIAKSLHISRSYVSRIEKRALDKLKKYLIS